MSAFIRLVCALALAAAATLSLTGAADASGSLCSAKGGVDVVVDYGSLGGGVAEGCAVHGAPTGDKAFAAAGYPLQYVPDQPGFVCAVAGKPARCTMPGSGDPWWGLFSSDGKSGKWTMAPVAVTKLKVPTNGAVAMVWESGKKVAKPSVAAPLVSDRSATTTSAKPGAATAAQDSTPAGGGGVPVWVPIVVVVVLVGAGGAVALRRRGAST
ncbi:MAG TPA: hypothetical protein VFM09_01785 [Marmoricola sp.]|nr:hypothetical protein [Marmoricola sp.]